MPSIRGLLGQCGRKIPKSTTGAGSPKPQWDSCLVPGCLVAGIVLKYDGLAAGGVAVLLLSGILAVVSYRRMAGMVTDRKGRRNRKASAKAPANSGLMERLEERWRRRQEGNNR